MWRSLYKKWSHLALTSRLMAIFSSTLVFSIVVTGVVVVMALNSYSIRQLDTQLNTALRILGLDAYNAATDETHTILPNDYYVRFYRIAEKDAKVIITQSIQEAYGMPLGAYLPTERDLQELTQTTSALMTGKTVPSTKNGEEWRIVSIIVALRGEPIGIATVGLSMNSLQDLLGSMVYMVFLSAMVLAIFGSMISNYMIGRAFRPLNEIEKVAGKIADGDLSQRVPPGPLSTEVGSLASSLNTMLSQIEQAFETQELSEQKMRRFVSDASHELRTPTAAIRGYAELSRMGGVPEDRREEVMGRIETEATRMGNLVEDLLTLARLDEQRPLSPKSTNITELAQWALQDLAVLSNRQVELLALGGEELQNEDVPKVEAVVDKDKISQLITNLLSNVRQHTPEGTPVEILVGYETWPQSQDGPGNSIRWKDAKKRDPEKMCVVIVVRDHGNGIARKDREKVFERFYRTDSSRARTSGGTGLGLAIVTGIVNMHNGKVSMEETPGGGLSVVVKIPRRDHLSLGTASSQ